MHGAAVFRGTRVPVRTLFDYLEGATRSRIFWTGSRPFRALLALETSEEAKQLRFP
jgi:hypothetical protein